MSDLGCPGAVQWSTCDSPGLSWAVLRLSCGFPGAVLLSCGCPGAVLRCPRLQFRLGCTWSSWPGLGVSAQSYYHCRLWPVSLGCVLLVLSWIVQTCPAMAWHNPPVHVQGQASLLCPVSCDPTLALAAAVPDVLQCWEYLPLPSLSMLPPSLPSPADVARLREDEGSTVRRRQAR